MGWCCSSQRYAPASDLAPFTTNLDTMIGGSVFESFIITAYRAIYPDVHFSEPLRPARRLHDRGRDRRACLSEPSALVSVATSLALDKSIFATPVTQGALDQPLEQNTPTGLIEAPLLIAQGETDQIVLPAMQRNYTHQLRTAGQPLDYRTFRGLDHISLVGKDSPLIAQLITWTQNRLDAKPASNDCPAV